MSAISKLSLSPFAPPSQTLARFNKLVSTSSGTDKLFMLYAYSSHVIMYILRSKRFTSKTRQDLALRIGKLGTFVSDARVLYRLFGVFPIIGWLQSQNDPRTKPADPKVALIQRLQGWAMLFYYPMEHIYYLAGKGMWDLSPVTIGRLAIWACRFWASYVVLQLFLIKREHTLLSQSKAKLASSRARTLKAAPEKGVSVEAVQEEKKEMVRIAKKEEALKTDLMVQVGYLPLTMHWSYPGGLLPDQLYVGIFGTIAAAFGLQGAWRATAA